MSSTTTNSSLPFYLCCIRPYRATDEFAVRDLLYHGHMSSLSTALLSALTRELLWQGLVVVLAILFVFFHLPGHICMLIVPGLLSAIIVAIWSSHRLRAAAAHGEAANIANTYCQSERTGCWVAEVFESLDRGVSNDASMSSAIASLARSSPVSAGDQDTNLVGSDRKGSSTFQLVFVSEGELSRYGSQLCADSVGRRSRVIGVCGLRHDRCSPADSAWLSSLAVASEYRRHGVGSQLVSLACRHALSPGGFRCVGAQATECQIAARALLNRQSFLSSSCELRPVFIGVSLNVFLFSKELKPSKTTKAQV